MLRGPRTALHLRPLHQARTPIGHLRPVQLRPTPRLSRFALSHGGADVRRPDQRKLDHRMRSRITPSWTNARYTVCMDFVVDLHSGSWIHEGHGRRRTDEDQVWRRVGTLRDESQVLVRSGSRLDDRESGRGAVVSLFFLVHVVRCSSLSR